MPNILALGTELKKHFAIILYHYTELQLSKMKNAKVMYLLSFLDYLSNFYYRKYLKLENRVPSYCNRNIRYYRMDLVKCYLVYEMGNAAIKIKFNYKITIKKKRK